MTANREEAASRGPARPAERGERIRRRRLRLLIALLLVAAGLRIWGCFGQGLPYSFNSDEKGNVVRALRFGAEATLDPGWFNKPALGFYVIFGEYGCYYLIGRVAGWFASTEDFADHFCNDQAPFYLIGRITFSLLGALTVLVTARLGRWLGGRQLGIASAMVLAVTAGHVAAGQHVKMDVPAAFFSTWALVAIVQVMRRGRTRDYVSAGILAGLSMATKYYGVALLLPLLLAHALRSPRARRRSPAWVLSGPLLAGLVSFLGGFFVASPYNFLSPMWFEERLLPHIRWVLEGIGLCPGGQIFEFRDMGPLVDQQTHTVAVRLEHLVGQLVSVQGIGLLLAVLTAAGLVRAALRRRRGDILLLVTFPYLVFLFAVSNHQFARPRHLVMLYPLAAVLAASGFEALWAAATQRWRGGRRNALALGLLALLLVIPIRGFPLYDTVLRNVERVAPDRRLRAIEEIQRTIPAGAVILNDGEALPLRFDRSRINWVLSQRVPRLEKLKLIDPAQIYASLARKWKIELRALEDHDGPDYDLLVMEHGWQFTKLRQRGGASKYNPLWVRSPWGEPIRDVVGEAVRELDMNLLADPVAVSWGAFRRRLPEGERQLAPVEFWTRVTTVSKQWLTVEKGRAVADPDSPRRPAEWMVTTRLFVDWYQEPAKAAAFPDYCAFYRDLAGHYACTEFAPPDPDDPLARMFTVRIYDLRKRYEDEAPPFIFVE